MLSKTFTLVYKEEISNRYINRGYIAYWLGQLLNKMGDYKNAYFSILFVSFIGKDTLHTEFLGLRMN